MESTWFAASWRGLDEGRHAARPKALSILATMQQELRDLDRLERIVKVFGTVNVAPGFNQTPAVLDGCSDLLVDVSAKPDITSEVRLDSPNCPSTLPSKLSSLLE